MDAIRYSPGFGFTPNRTLGRDGTSIPGTVPTGGSVPTSARSSRANAPVRSNVKQATETSLRLGANAPFDANYQKPQPKQDGKAVSGAPAAAMAVPKGSTLKMSSGLILLGLLIILGLGALFGRRL